MEWIMKGFRFPVVMVVDDEEAVLRFIRYVLENAGYEVLTAQNSVDALQQAAEYRGPIDVLLSDFEMKIFQNGADLATRFRILRPGTEVLLMSASPLPEGVDPKGATWEFLPKPFPPWQLLEQVGALIGSGSQARKPVALLTQS